MPAAGAPDRNGEVTFPLTLETWQTKFEQRRDALQKPAAVRLRQHEVFHRLARTGQIPQLGHEMRVVQETHVEQQIRIDGRAKLEAKRHEAGVHARRTARAWPEMRGYPAPQLVHAEPG